uniref:Ribosomal RNA-processing protein 4 n=1 Tax=Globodera pallida TaxID=36090 RepID=A0A183CFG1_GLOPA
MDASTDNGIKFNGGKAAAASALCIGSPPRGRRVLAVGDASGTTNRCLGTAPSSSSFAQNQLQLTVPGALICPAVGLMRGHGTFLQENALHSSLAGAVIQTNKLIRVKPVKSRYQGDIGDVVVGRIVEVQQKRWKVDTNSRLHSVLLLNSVNLPGGELRRKSIEDELLMREYLREGDLVSAEVQQLFHDGALSLHTRSLKYGKLGQGVLVKVLPHLVRQRKSHFHNLPFGSSVILGRNGNIWVSRHLSEDESSTGGYLEDTQLVPLETREVIARTANCIKLLARNSVSLYDTTIICAYHASLPFPVKRLVDAAVADMVARETVSQCSIGAEAGDEDEPMPLT